MYVLTSQIIQLSHCRIGSTNAKYASFKLRVGVTYTCMYDPHSNFETGQFFIIIFAVFQASAKFL